MEVGKDFQERIEEKNMHAMHNKREKESLLLLIHPLESINYFIFSFN